jgi:hypothetical protein
MALEPKTWTTSILFDMWILHFKPSIQPCGGNLCTFNCHLFILDGHNSYVIINFVHKSKALYNKIMTNNTFNHLKQVAKWGWISLLYHHTQAMHYNLWMLHVLNHSKLHLKHINIVRHWFTKGKPLKRKIWHNWCPWFLQNK